MAGLDALNSTQFFHGSPHEYEEGQIIDPSEVRSRRINFSRDPGVAHFFGQSNKTAPGPARLYQIEPLGEYGPDPETPANWAAAHATSDPVRVVRRVRLEP